MVWPNLLHLALLCLSVYLIIGVIGCIGRAHCYWLGVLVVLTADWLYWSCSLLIGWDDHSGPTQVWSNNGPNYNKFHPAEKNFKVCGGRNFEILIRWRKCFLIRRPELVVIRSITCTAPLRDVFLLCSCLSTIGQNWLFMSCHKPDSSLFGTCNIQISQLCHLSHYILFYLFRFDYEST